MSGRQNLAVGDVYHAVMKLMAAARSKTLTELVEELLFEGLSREFRSDPALAFVVRELVKRDEKADPDLRGRTLRLLDKLAPEQAEGA
jgi:hypothetical protein